MCAERERFVTQSKPFHRKGKFETLVSTKDKSNLQARTGFCVTNVPEWLCATRSPSGRTRLSGTAVWDAPAPGQTWLRAVIEKCCLLILR